VFLKLLKPHIELILAGIIWLQTIAKIYIMAKVGRYKFLELMLAHVLIQEAAVHIAS
jgi:hypothetical protein